MSYRPLLDYKLEKLNDEIVWGEQRKNHIKSSIQEKISNKNMKDKTFLIGDWLKVSFSLAFVGLICFVLFSNLFFEKMDFFGSQNADSENYSWYNLEIQPVLTAKDLKGEWEWKWAPFESYPIMIESYKNFDLGESQKLASFEIMRPNFDLNMPLEISKGVLSYQPSIPKKNIEKIISYWDIWHMGDKWVWSKQSLAENSKQLLGTAEKKVTWKKRVNTKVILNNNQAIAVLDNEGEDGIWINMKVKNEMKQVIEFQIRGNIDEEELIKLAKSYLE
jgi:hypothetical protein